jgi:hypothetical protein
MKTDANAFVRRSGRWALVPAIAVVGMFVGLTSAFAGQGSNQATDYALSWGAAGGVHSGGPYAQAGHGNVPRRHHRR